MKKLMLLLMMATGFSALNAQSNADAKVAEFNKLVTAFTSGKAVETELMKAYNEINCMLTKEQARQIDPTFDSKRKTSCGGTNYPASKNVSDTAFKSYVVHVEKYRTYKASNK